RARQAGAKEERDRESDEERQVRGFDRLDGADLAVLRGRGEAEIERGQRGHARDRPDERPAHDLGDAVEGHVAATPPEARSEAENARRKERGQARDADIEVAGDVY